MRIVIFIFAFCSCAVAQLTTPTITPSTGTYVNVVSVSFSGSGSGVTYCWTANGSNPTAATAGTCDSNGGVEFSAYNLPFVNIPTTGTTVSVLATKSGSTNSSVATATYTLTSLPSQSPYFTYSTPVKLTSATGHIVNGLPTLIKAANGTLLLFYTQCPNGDYDIVGPCLAMLKTSTNGGVSWSDWGNQSNCATATTGCFYYSTTASTVIDYAEGGGLSSTGTIVVFGNEWAMPGFDPDGVWYFYSTNNGTTWTGPNWITAGEAQTYWDNPASNMISIPSGSPGVTGSCSTGCLIQEMSGDSTDYLLFSYNDGQTWSTAVSTNWAYITEEVGLAWPGGMTLSAFARSNDYAYPYGPVNPYFTVSTNLGTSWTTNSAWSTPSVSNFSLLSCSGWPNFQDATTRPTVVIDPQNSSLVTYMTGNRWYCPSQSPGYSAAWQFNTVNLSTLISNSGLSFPIPQIINVYGSLSDSYATSMPHAGYGYIVPLTSNSLLFAYEQGQGGESGEGNEDIYTTVLTYQNVGLEFGNGISIGKGVSVY